MPETINAIPDPTKSGDAAVHQDQTAAPAPTNGYTREDFLTALNKLAALAREAAELRKRKNLVRRAIKNQGMDLNILDQVAKELDADPETLRANNAELARMRVFAGLAPAETMNLFSVVAKIDEMDEDARMKAIYDEAYTRSFAGKSLLEDNPHADMTPAWQSWREGWTDAQKKLAATAIGFDEMLAKAEAAGDGGDDE